jgi:predicted small lipoprotein YifL
LHRSRRAAFFPALAIFSASLALAACGVKGELEAPPAARHSEPRASAAGESAGGQQKVFTEQSRVVRGSAFRVIPRLPPKEWEKYRNPPAEAKSPAPEQRAKKSSAPDKPFALDWLL